MPRWIQMCISLIILLGGIRSADAPMSAVPIARKIRGGDTQSRSSSSSLSKYAYSFRHVFINHISRAWSRQSANNADMVKLMSANNACQVIVLSLLTRDRREFDQLTVFCLSDYR